jgi:hypothetical protein
MASIVIKVKNTDKILGGLKQITARSILPATFNEAHQSIRNAIFEKFIEHLGHHPIILGILGFYAGDEERDLQAIFGIDDVVKDIIVDSIKQLVIDNLSIEYHVTKNIFILNISTKSNLASELRDRAGSEYDYYSRKHRSVISIPWIDWLFDGVALKTSITFDLTDKRQLTSRSGRATMIMDESEEPFTYSPTQLSKTGNFFLDISESKEFQTDVMDIITIIINKHIRGLNIHV